jgi:DNA-binding response OmpR family regulator
MKRVLIVDDERYLHSVLTPMLYKTFNCEISSCFDTNSAYGYVESNQVDAIVLDINMPNSNSLNFLERLQTDSRFSKIPVVVLSSLASEEAHTAFLTNGAKATFNKTVLFDDVGRQQLLDTLKQWLT